MAWHEECLRNHELHHLGKEKEFARAKLAFECSYAQLTHHREQVAIAKDRGLEAYDPDKFLVPRKKK
jgi:hypothetical protein